MSSKGRIVFPHGIPGATKHEGEACVVTMRYRTGEETPQQADTDMKYVMHPGWVYNDLIEMITADVDNTFGGIAGVDRIYFISTQLTDLPDNVYN